MDAGAPRRAGIDLAYLSPAYSGDADGARCVSGAVGCRPDTYGHPHLCTPAQYRPCEKTDHRLTHVAALSQRDWTLSARVGSSDPQYCLVAPCDITAVFTPRGRGTGHRGGREHHGTWSP